MSYDGNIYEDAMESISQLSSTENLLSWAKKLREAAEVETYRSQFLINTAWNLEECAWMPELLQQLEDMGIKRNTMFGGAPTGRGQTGYWTHLAPKDCDFDPCISPVFGKTEYESLKEAIALEVQIREYMTGWSKIPFACSIPAEVGDR